MNGVQTRFKCKLDVKRCKRFVFPPSSLLPRSNALKTKAIRYFQTDQTLTRIVSSPLNVYYRFAEMPYKLAPNESPYETPKGKEFSVIVLNADFEIIGETKFPGKKYFYKMSFVGREGLYISENNLENPQFDENKLVFTCFKIKNASPNK